MNILLKNISYASCVSIFIFFAFPLLALAQVQPYGNRADAEGASVSGAYHPPALYVSAITLDSADITTEVKGSFHVLNQAEDILGDIKYRLEILSPLQVNVGKDIVIADAPTVYAQSLSKDTLAFIPKEERDIPFSYTVPALPIGEYRFRIKLVTTQGKELGWDDQTIQVTNGSATFAILTHGPIEVPVFKDEVIPPTFGVTVSPSSSFTITAEADNATDVSLPAFPVLDVYAYGITGKKITSITGSPVTLDPQKSQGITVPVTAEAAPGVYYGVLTLRTAEGTQISSIADYRWIVRGESARIVSARIAKLETKQGGKVVVNVDYVGPADAQTALEGKISISLLDQQGTVGTFDVPSEIALRDSISSGEATVELQRDLVGAPGLKVILTDISGKILDTYIISLPLSDQQLNTLLGVSSEKSSPFSGFSAPYSIKKIVMIVGAILLVGVIVFYAIWKRKSSSVSSLILLILIGSGVGMFPSITEAGIRVVFPKTDKEVADAPEFDNNWKSLPNAYIVEMFVNKPIHDATYENGKIPLEFNVLYGASNSDIAYTRNFFRYAPGVHVSSYDASWVDLGNKDFNASNACGAGHNNNNKCFVTSTYVAQPLLNFAEQPSNAVDATLQLVSKWGVGSLPSASLPANAADFSGLADGINTWVKFATAEPTVTPTPLVCADRARMSIDFQEIDTKRASNEHPTLPISFFGNGDQAGDAVFVDLVKENGQPVIDGKLPTNVDGLAVERGDGFVTIQLYSTGRDNKGKECVSADINLEHAKFTSFQNIGSNWKVRSERPEDGKWRFCRNAKDEVFPGVGTSHAEMISAAGPKNDTFTLYYKADATQGLPICPIVTPSTGPATPTPTSGPTPTLTVTPSTAPSTNHPPVGIAKISVDGATSSSSVTVTKGQATVISLSAAESSDPDGWTTPNKGVSTGGKCEWNSDLNQGSPTFETTIQNPLSPATCNINLGPLVFNDAPGTYTYNLLRITDASGAVSSDGTVSVTVVEAPIPQCSNGLDDNDPEDSLADSHDPGCHANNDSTQPYVPTDDDEKNPVGVTPLPSVGTTVNPGGFTETR